METANRKRFKNYLPQKRENNPHHHRQSRGPAEHRTGSPRSRLHFWRHAPWRRYSACGSSTRTEVKPRLGVDWKRNKRSIRSSSGKPRVTGLCTHRGRFRRQDRHTKGIQRYPCPNLSVSSIANCAKKINSATRDGSGARSFVFGVLNRKHRRTNIRGGIEWLVRGVWRIHKRTDIHARHKAVEIYASQSALGIHWSHEKPAVPFYLSKISTPKHSQHHELAWWVLEPIEKLTERASRKKQGENPEDCDRDSEKTDCLNYH